MNIISEDIKDMLEGESSLGLLHLNNLFIGKEPALPKDCVTLFDNPGSPARLTIAGKGENYYYCSLGIRVRNHNYATGLQLAQNIADFLHGMSQQTVNGTLYTVIYCSNGPALLDWDENGNARFIMNINLQRR